MCVLIVCMQYILQSITCQNIAKGSLFESTFIKWIKLYEDMLIWDQKPAAGFQRGWSVKGLITGWKNLPPFIWCESLAFVKANNECEMKQMLKLSVTSGYRFDLVKSCWIITHRSPYQLQLFSSLLSRAALHIRYSSVLLLHHNYLSFFHFS